MIFPLLAEVDDVHCEVILLELLGEGYQCGLILFNGAGDEGHDALRLFLIDAVLEGQLRDVGGYGELDGALEALVLAGRDQLVDVVGRRHQ